MPVRQAITYFFTLMLLHVQCLPAAAAGEAGFECRQFSDYEGNVTIKFANSAARIDAGGLYTLILLKDQTALIYNHKNKTYCQSPRRKLSALFGSGKEYASNQTRKGRSGIVAGMKASEYICRSYSPQGKLAYTTEFWTCRNVAVPAGYVDDYAMICDVPRGYGIPLRAVRDTGGKKVKTIDTLSMRKMIFPPQIFQPLKGYRKVDDEMDMLIDSGSKGDDLSALLGGGLAGDKENPAKPAGKRAR